MWHDAPPTANGEAHHGLRPAGFPSRRPVAWVWFYATLWVLTTAAITINYLYTTSRQLTPETVIAAQRRWAEAQPRDYDLEYRRAGDEPGNFVARVRDGEIRMVTRDGILLPKAAFAGHDMPGLFGLIRAELEADARPGQPAAFARGMFDAADGHVIYYLHSVRATGARHEIVVRFETVPAGTIVPEFPENR